VSGSIDRPTEQGIRGRTGQRLDNLERRVSWRPGEQLPVDSSTFAWRAYADPGSNTDVIFGGTNYVPNTTLTFTARARSFLLLTAHITIQHRTTGWKNVLAGWFVDGVSLNNTGVGAPAMYWPDIGNSNGASGPFDSRSTSLLYEFASGEHEARLSISKTLNAGVVRVWTGDSLSHIQAVLLAGDITVETT